MNRNDRILLHKITRELESLELGSEGVDGLRMPANEPENLRPTGDQIRSMVPPTQRQRVIRNAINRTGSNSYLVRYGCGHTYKAVIGGKEYAGTFAQVTDQIAHLIFPFIHE